MVPVRRAWRLPVFAVAAAALAACSPGSDVSVGDVTPDTSVTDTTDGTGRTVVPPPPPEPPATTPTTTAAPTTVATTAPPVDTRPLRIEDAAVAVWSAWPSGIGAVGPTRLRSFVPGTDDAPPRDGESIPPTPGVPHGYTLAT